MRMIVVSNFHYSQSYGARMRILIKLRNRKVTVVCNGHVFLFETDDGQSKRKVTVVCDELQTNYFDIYIYILY